MMTDSTIMDEFARVFGSLDSDASGGLKADGWPDYVRYDAEIAIHVLRQFPDGHGETEDGDAEVCAALDAAGARAKV